MQITFDTTNLKDVQGIRAMLDAMHPRTVTVTNTGERLAQGLTPTIRVEDNPATGIDTAQMFASGGPVSAPASNVIQLPTAQAGAPAIDRDSEGYPWDARIHSSTKKQTEAGAWVLRKGIKNDPAMLERVRAELRTLIALPASAAPQVANVAPVFPQAQAAAPALTLPASTQQPPNVAALPALPQSIAPTLPLSLPAALPPVVLPDPTTVGELMARVGPALASLKMQPSAIQEACTRLSIPSLEALVSANRPDLVVAVWKELQPLTV